MSKIDADLLSREGESTIGTVISIANRGYQRGRTLHNRVSMTARRKYHSREVGRVTEGEFDQVLDQYADEDTAFIHIGLSDIKKAFDRDPYQFLLNRLDNRFESILNPGFTPTFRSVDGAVYHKQHSLPKFGAFSRLFLEDCDYRTNDPTNSILIRGPYRFDSCNHFDTWSKEGCFNKLDREDVLYLNIGTDWLRSSQIHYIENIIDVPYIQTQEYEGVIYSDDESWEEITHRSHEYTMPVTWNRVKLRKDLESAGVLVTYDLNGLQVFATHARKLREVLTSRILADPYYLVT